MISVWIKEEVRVAELPVPKTGEIVYDEVFSHMHLGCDPDFCDDLPLSLIHISEPTRRS